MAVAQIGVAGIDMKGRVVDIVDAVGGLESVRLCWRCV